MAKQIIRLTEGELNESSLVDDIDITQIPIEVLRQGYFDYRLVPQSTMYGNILMDKKEAYCPNSFFDNGNVSIGEFKTMEDAMNFPLREIWSVNRVQDNEFNSYVSRGCRLLIICDWDKSIQDSQKFVVALISRSGKVTYWDMNDLPIDAKQYENSIDEDVLTAIFAAAYGVIASKIPLYLVLNAYKDWKRYVVKFYSDNNVQLPNINQLGYNQVIKITNECKRKYAKPNQIYDKDGIYVGVLSTFEMANMLPINTTWCITQTPHRYAEFNNDNQKCLYIINNKNADPYRRVIAVCSIDNVEYWDSKNHRMEEEEVVSYEKTLPIEVENIIHNFAY